MGKKAYIYMPGVQEDGSLLASSEQDGTVWQPVLLGIRGGGGTSGCLLRNAVGIDHSTSGKHSLQVLSGSHQTNQVFHLYHNQESPLAHQAGQISHG